MLPLLRQRTGQSDRRPQADECQLSGIRRFNPQDKRAEYAFLGGEIGVIVCRLEIMTWFFLYRWTNLVSTILAWLVLFNVSFQVAHRRMDYNFSKGLSGTISGLCVLIISLFQCSI